MESCENAVQPQNFTIGSKSVLVNEFVLFFDHQVFFRDHQLFVKHWGNFRQSEAVETR